MAFLIFLLLVIFPFGQLLRVSLLVGSTPVTLQPIDAVALTGFLVFLLRKGKIPEIYWGFFSFLLTALFSFWVGIGVSGIKDSWVGGLYLLRLMVYFSFPLLIYNFVKTQQGMKVILYDGLIAVTAAVAIFGWIQYFLYPDLRPLAFWGWDDHLFRLVGTFLDPGFTSVILVFGILITLLKYEQLKSKKLLALALFFLVTLAFTYSRAGYLALGAGLSAMGVIKKKMKWVALGLAGFLLLVGALPRPGGEGVNLLRTASVAARLTNYQETWQRFLDSPLVGVGYNNLCRERPYSHACSGADASLLTILATTGMVGILAFLGLVAGVGKHLTRDIYGEAVVICTVALAVHSLFVNSLFYPWVMVLVGILFALATKERRKQSG